MITLQEALDMTGLSLTAVGEMVNLGKSAISRVKSHDYPNWEAIERAIIIKMAEAGLIKREAGIDLELPSDKGTLKVDPYAFISTQNVKAVNALASDLLNPTTTLNASIGMITGSAGYGKTTTIRRFASTNDPAVYVLFLEGYTLNVLLKQICRELTGFAQGSFEKNLLQIREATCIYRKLIIIDEADRMPLKVIEAMRGINEYCGVPLLLVGEESLVAKMETLPRLKSRIRKPEIVFKSLTPVDVATFYQQAIGIDISDSMTICKALLKLCHKDFRVLVNDAQHLCQVMNASNIKTLTEEVLNAYRASRA